MINIGLIGFGYWGPNLARNFSQNPELELDGHLRLLGRPAGERPALVPACGCDCSLDDFFKADLDAVAIATPVATHFELARRAFESGRHVWLEKPMTGRSTRPSADRARAGEAESAAGGPHLRLYRRGAQDQGLDRQVAARRPDLLRFHPGQPRVVPAGRERALGPRAARHLHHGLPHAVPETRGFRHRARTTTATASCPSRC